MEVSVDERKMLEALRSPDNWAPRITRIANALGIPTSTAQSRLKRLEQGGVFSGFGVASSDYGFACFAVGRARDPAEAAPKLLSAIQGIEEVHAIAGESNLLVRFRAQDREGYLSKVQQMGGVFDVRFASLSAKVFR